MKSCAGGLDGDAGARVADQDGLWGSTSAVDDGDGSPTTASSSGFSASTAKWRVSLIYLIGENLAFEIRQEAGSPLPEKTNPK